MQQVKKNKLAIFDFCDTLIGFQTAQAFVDYAFIIHKSSLRPFKRFFLFFYDIKYLPGFVRKRLQLLKLRGIEEATMYDLAGKFVDDFILPKENSALVEALNLHEKRGDTVVIVSGTFTILLKEYARVRGLQSFLGTDLLFASGKFSGLIEGLDCMGKNKLSKLNALLDLENFDLSNSCVYSDDYYSDRCLFDLVGKGFFVDRGQIVPLKK